MIKKIAILAPKSEKNQQAKNLLSALAASKGWDSKVFHTSDLITAFQPDCVIALSPEDAKLTPYPTYGYLDRPAQDYLSLPRYIRNLMTYDGYLTDNAELRQMLDDLMFGARKLDSSITNPEDLAALHATTLVKKGYVAAPQEYSERLPSITYIIRTGGRHRQFLERALDSLIAQNYPNIKVIFCIYKKFDYLNEIIAHYPALDITAILREKSIRSTAICDGLAAVKTDLFGLFDDDDELHPNHVRSLVNALTYHQLRDWRQDIGLVYSGSIIINDSSEVYENSEYRDLKLKNRHEKRVIEHFRFYRPNEMSQHNWYMMSNAWLAKASLIDSELLTDPLIDTCEDLYFELQMAQRTHFAFSVEVTAIHHFHGTNSTLVDNERHLPDTQRIALRNFSRTLNSENVYDTHYNRAGRSKHSWHHIDPFYPQRQPKGFLHRTLLKHFINAKYFGMRKTLQKLMARLVKT